VLAKIGRVAVRRNRSLHGAPKTVTISREADGWYVGCSCAAVPTQPLPHTDRETGIDVGLQVLLVTADGLAADSPRHLRKAEKALKKASHRRKKAVHLRGRKHQKVRRQRRDHHHKAALLLVRAYDTIYLEDVQVRNLVRNRHLSKSIADAGWAQFRTILAYKAACAGRRVLAVPPAYTSQDCSGCGERVPKRVRVRTHVCPTCGLVPDRDAHAAQHILRAGQAPQARTPSAGTYVA
jgi:putative transposase